MGIVQIFAYACAVVCIAAVVVRVVRYTTTPIHLRWELYPVAHEKGRASYGGSIFEEMDWWTKPREVDRVNELKEMFKEIVFLKGVYEHNRKLWLFSFPFHFGLYMAIGWLALLFLAAILTAAGVAISGGLANAFVVAASILGYGGLGLTALGAVGLFFRRAGDAEIRRYSTPAEYFNLMFVLAAVGVALGVHIATDPSFGQLTAFLAAFVSFGSAEGLPVATGVEVLAGSLLVAYIPVSRMAHFVAKYFLYHDVRWSDEPNPRGSKIEGRVKEAFGYEMQWTGPHIESGKSWAEVGTKEFGNDKKDSKAGKEAKA
jgi:nitrate reductase gamma subunit